MLKLPYLVLVVCMSLPFSCNAQCDSLSVSVLQISSENCNGDSAGLIVVSGTGGTQPYQYSLTGASYQVSDSFTNLAADNYSLYVKDSIGCIYVDTAGANVTQPQLLRVSVNTTAVTTNGGGNNGTAVAVALNGIAPYPCYLWGNGAIDSGITHLQAGSYCVTICDAHNCSASACGNVGSVIYHYLLDTINIWYYTYDFCYLSPPSSGNSNLRSLPVCGSPEQRGIVWTGEDSVFNNLTYRQVDVSNSFYQLQTDSCYLGLIREDTLTGKVYFIRDTSTTEILLYNFGMQVGQTMLIAFADSSVHNGGNYAGFGYNYFRNGNYKLDSISTINISAGLRKQYNLSCDSNYGAVTWVESVGDLADVLYPNTWIGTCSYSYYVVCFEHNYHVYFDTAAYLNAVNGNYNCEYEVIDSCEFSGGCGGINELRALGSFTVYPVPAADNVTFALDVTQDATFDIYIKDVEGCDVGKHMGLGNLSPGTYKRQLSVENLNPGLYFIECRSGSGSLYSKMLVQR